MNPTCVLLDLDGTLVASAPGIIASARTALIRVGAVVPDEGVLRTFVGPPMYQSFREVLGLDEPTARTALEAYRAEYARAGAVNSALFAGIREAIETLDAARMPMAVATSKVEDQAVRMIRHHGLGDLITTVCGTSDEAGRTSKRSVIRECLARLSGSGVDVARPVMVGDRAYDVASAAAEQLPTVYVQWGYGSPTEAAGAATSVRSPSELAALLLASTNATA
ncbi:HAD hydrolase-like protein [Micrococcus luteus]